MSTPLSIDQQIADDLSRFWDNPLAFVRYAYPWGTGELRGFMGPDVWQAEFLTQVGVEVHQRAFDGVHAVAPIQMATSSGHGIGKTALVAWLVHWILSTRPYSKGVVTANTAPQLSSKTWPEIVKWFKRGINAHWWHITSGQGAMHIQHVSHSESWRVDAQTCREENSESFAGLHAASSTPFFIFDEASAIPDKIWEVSQGGLTDGEPMFLAFGNPTRNTGAFHRCFHGQRHRWITRQIDSRSVAITNKAKIAEWIEDYGEDSDFVRIRVRGVFPRASAMQFIPSDVVWAARKAEGTILDDDPLILGIDVARGGEDANVLQYRRGRRARPVTNSVPPTLVIPGEKTRDSMKLVSAIIDQISTHKPDAIFVDGTGVGGPIVDRIRQLGFNVFEVQFAGEPPDLHYANMRAYMWGRMREWLMTGGAIEESNELESDLIGPEYFHNRRDQLVLESKEDMKDRGLSSPDRGDALALTFAAPVASRPTAGVQPLAQQFSQPRDYVPKL